MQTRSAAMKARLHAPMLVALAMAPMAASAQWLGDEIERSGAAPRDTAAITSLDSDPYWTDPAFHGGEYIEDAFYSNQNAPNNYFSGRKVVRLSNGDLVTAALVKNPNGNQTNGRWNIGLVRYDAAGSARLAWPNGGAYAHANGEYIVFPKTDTANYSWIQDIRAIDGRILVAVNLDFGGTDDIDTAVIVFGEDGSFQSNTRVFGSSMAEYVGGMEVYGTVGGEPQVLVVATQAPRESAGGGIGRPMFGRWTLEASGALTPEAGPMTLATHWCDDPGRDCRPAGIALGFRGIGVPSIYVLNRYYQTAADQPGWSYAVTRIGSNGTPDPAWPGLWWYLTDGGVPGAHYNWATAISIRTTGLGLPESPYRDSVFIASEIGRSCGNGMFVSKHDHDYNPVGQTIFGGSTASAALCQALGEPVDWPMDMHLSGNRLAVVGYGKTSPLAIPGEPVPEDRVDAFVAVLDAASAAPNLLDFKDYRYPIGGTRDRHSAFWGLTSTTAGRFVAVGTNRFRDDDDVPSTLRGKTSVAILGIAPDRIFGDGFEN